MNRWVRRAAGGLLSDEKGSVAVLFSLMLVGLVLAGGVALDYGRLLHIRTGLVSAADAAALAAGRALGQGGRSDSEIRDLARSFFDANLGNADSFGDLSAFSVAVDRDAASVKVNVRARVPMTLTRIAGIDSVDLPVSATTVSSQRDIELALVLDVTGSMGSPSSKIADLRTAASDLVELMLPDQGRPGQVRMALAPYAASLNAGSYFRAVTGRTSGTGCVIERGGSARFREDAPAAGSYLGYDRNVACPTATVQPLTDRKATLKAQISGLRPDGMTAGHIGTAWGWYLLSPRWNGILPAANRPAAYEPKKTIKAMLLMTDGEFNTQYVSGNGTSAAQARALCTNMKAQGVVIYSVAFMAGRSAETMLRECATSAGHYFSAANGTALRQAFQAVGQSLSDLHLTH